MKLATVDNGGRDGALVVVSRDLARAISPEGIAATLQEALDNWAEVEADLQLIADHLEAGEGLRFNPVNALAPLPRAWQWLDGSAFGNHGDLMQKAFNLPPIETDLPLMYQGMSHEFLSAGAPARFPSEADGIDFEGEFGVITDYVPMGTTADEALAHIKLCLVINDWSLRAIAPIEMKTGFGWIQAKPVCALSPVAITPDELGPLWKDGRIQARMIATLNGQRFGAVPATEMAFGFHELIAHAARSRNLAAGTIIGSGTVSSSAYAEVGSCCISERRAIEMIAHGRPLTPFMRAGDTISLQTDELGLFGQIHQRVELA
jgi:fumarylacetoacetate (FAA) hydrolase